jgi:hypothetical protein
MKTCGSPVTPNVFGQELSNEAPEGVELGGEADIRHGWQSMTSAPGVASAIPSGSRVISGVFADLAAGDTTVLLLVWTAIEQVGVGKRHCH